MTYVVEEGFVDYLAGDGTITGLIGSGNDLRCYPGRVLAAVAMPAIRWTLASNVRTGRYLNGVVAGPEDAVIHCDCLGDTYDDARALADAVIARFDGTEATLTSGVDGYCEADELGSGFYRAPDAATGADRHQITVEIRIYRRTS